MNEFKRAFAKINAMFLGHPADDHEFKALDTKQTFNKIYRQKIWGRTRQGEASSGSGSHQAHLVKPYVKAMENLLAQYETPPTMVDLGCGDFNIGRHFTKAVSTLTACDISNIILAQNAKNFSSDNLVFQQCDLTKDPLPRGDIACLRQVLQHLTNEDICGFVSTMHNQTPYKQLVVTEHICSKAELTPNIDKTSGPSTRVSLNSGVDLALPPFSLVFSKHEVLLEIPEPCDGKVAVLRTTLYTFS